MRAFQRIIILCFVIVLLAFSAVQFRQHVLLDTVPPVISMDSGEISVSVNDPQSALLEGVTASDDRDGDVTAAVMIRSVSGLIGPDTAKVSYVVFDSSNNMASASRTLRYTDYEKPQFALKRPLVYSVGSTVRLLDRLSAHDVIDGNISRDIRVTAQNLSAEREGVYTVTVQVTNSMGDTASLPLKVVVNDACAHDRLIRLQDYIVYLRTGESFDPAQYVESVRSEDGAELNASALDIRSDVDSAVPGIYEVSYTYHADTYDYTAYMTVAVE